jgi:O-antigen ligase
LAQPRIEKASRAANGQFWSLFALLVVATAFGGGGSRYGLVNLVVQLTAIGALSFHRQAFVAFCTDCPRSLKVIAAFSVLLPLLFLLPLPPQIWTQLPGREAVVQSLELSGGISWITASVDPVRTLLALTALITPFAVLIIGLQFRRSRLITLGWIVVGLGLVNVLIGIVQVLSNGETGLFYPENPMPGVLFGTFANRNSTGLFLVACLAFAALLPAPRQIGQFATPARLLICALLILAVILTRSRTATVLSALPIAAIALQAIGHRKAAPALRQSARRGTKWITPSVCALALATITAVGVAAPGRIGDLMDRFQDERTDARNYIWEDAAYSAKRYWPVGAGIGTFDEVFQIDESLENVTQRRAGRAHNDYLEVAIESGLAGILLVAAWLSLVTSLSWKARASEDRWIAWSGTIVLSAIAAQSITDYPLRNHSMLAIASFALVVLCRFGTAGQAGRR